MSEVQTAVKPIVVPKRSAHKTGGPALGQDASREAKRQAAAVLEVLAGLRTPAQAASALEMSVPCYYLLESRALEGLVRSCEPRRTGRQRSAVQEVTALRHENERLQREVARQQALVRLAQRSVGLTPPAALPLRPGKKARQRRPVARALKVAQRLQQEHPEQVPAAAAPETQEATVGEPSPVRGRVSV